MPRPEKCRRVEYFPTHTYFVPLNTKNPVINEVVLKVEELEAMRLKDILKLNQEECAKKMNVSRQTFQNIISNAREKVALALTEGTAINITGGNYVLNKCELKCLTCGEIFKMNINEDKLICPTCGNKDIICSKKEKGYFKSCNWRSR